MSNAVMYEVCSHGMEYVETSINVLYARTLYREYDFSDFRAVTLDRKWNRVKNE